MIFLRFIFVFVSITLGSFLFAGEEVFSARIEGAEIVTGQLIVLSDDKYDEMLLDQLWMDRFFNYKVSNRVRLGYDPEALSDDDGELSVELSITGVKADGTQISFNRMLTAEYNNSDGFIDIQDLNTFAFKDCHKVDVEILSVTGSSANFYLQSEIDVERYYHFDYLEKVVSGLNVIQNNGAYLEVYWSDIQGAEEYELEYVHVNDYTANSSEFKDESILRYNFYLNSTRVSTLSNYHRIPNTFDHGYFLFRVRAIGRNSADWSRKLYGKWNETESGIIADLVYDINKYKIDTEFDAEKNWNYQLNLTEEGKRFEGVSYVDGLGRTRQSVGHNTETDQTLVTNMYYDSHGRPVVSVLPSPEDTEELSYRNNFNYFITTDDESNTIELPFTGKEYDYISQSEDPCLYPERIKLSKNHGSGKYYSEQNMNQDGEAENIPNANHFPYARIEYTPDQTGRVKRVGSFGEEFQIGGGHETTYYYSSPSQEELTRLFGSEVGKNNQYQKRLTKDANGQFYVEYYDLAGRVVASGMLGSSPNNLDELSNNIPMDDFTQTIIGENTYDLSTVSSAVVFSKPEVITSSDDYTFNFYMTPEDFQSECMNGEICFDCLYDVSLSVIDECGEVVYEKTLPILGQVLDDSCIDSEPLSDEITLFLEVGEYQFERSISINQAAKDAYWCMFLASDNCIPSYTSIYNEYYENAVFDGCNDVEFSLGTDEDGAQDCNVLLEQFVYDLSPGGQYGLYLVDGNGNYSAPDPLSIFNTQNSLGGRWNDPYTDYLDSEGNIAYISLTYDGTNYSPAVNPSSVLEGEVPGTYKTTPDKLLDVKDFIELFYSEPQWALSLVQFHPEYCYYEFCQANLSFHEYNFELSNIIEMDEACSMGAVNPLGLASFDGSPILSTEDPFDCSTCATCDLEDVFFTTGPGSVYLSAIENEMNNFILVGNETETEWVDIWSYAVVAGTDESYSSVSEFADKVKKYRKGCFDDAVWLTFRNLYMQLRQKYFKMAELDYAMENGCYSGCIGNSPFSSSTIVGDGTFGSYTLENGTTISGTGPCSTPGLYSDRVSRVVDATTMANTSASSSSEYVDYEADIIEQCESICESQATNWINDIEGCVTNGTVEALRLDLIAFCQAGCSTTSLSGLSTSATSITVPSGGGYTSMEEIVNYYIGNPTGDCNYFLIEDLPPTHEEPSPLATPILDECGCELLFETRSAFEAFGTNLPVGITNIEEYFYSQNGVWFDDLDKLLCNCDKAVAGSGLPSIVTLEIPVDMILTCFEGCSDCITVEAIANDISNYFTQEDVTFSENYPIILMNWANRELGFNLSGGAYIDFLTTCSGGTLEPVCNLTPQATDFESMLNVIIRRGQLLVPSSAPLDLNVENVVYANTNISDLLGNTYWSCAGEACDNNNLSLSFENETGSCVINLSIPADFQGMFSFEDIVGIQSLQAEGVDCDAVNSFSMVVDYYDCGERKSGLVNGTSACFDISECNCGQNSQICDNPYSAEEASPCFGNDLHAINQLADEQYDNNLVLGRQQFEEDYTDQCKLAFNNSNWEYTGGLRGYQYTLFYYDQAGNLSTTVAPQGIDLFDQAEIESAADNMELTTLENSTSTTGLVPNHGFKTKYEYNSYNQLTQTTNPDQDGETHFWYDRYGRIVASQNPKQYDLALYSYTFYDVQGRPVEVGQVSRYTKGDEVLILLNEGIVKEDDLGVRFQNYVRAGTRTEVTRTYYDEPARDEFNALFESGVQENLRLRVASVLYFATLPNEDLDIENAENYESAIHYSYDQHGNVIESIQDVPMMSAVAQQHKSTAYEFELISGNVSKVAYQKGKPDQLVHEYCYDEINRLTEVYTTTDGVHKSRDAAYQYYDYGPLSRMEIGEYNIQGTDYAYTINGWLKGVNSNSLNPDIDMGNDGTVGFLSLNNNVHSNFAEDVIGYSLGYFEGDYSPIGGNSFEGDYIGSNFNNASSNLYNGNIRHTVTSIKGIGKTQGKAYSYDQLQRLTKMEVFYPGADFQNTNNWINDVSSLEYLTQITYDKNGNITTLLRNGSNDVGLNMDRFDYKYYSDAGSNATGVSTGYLSNRLSFVVDIASDNIQYSDIKTGMTNNNYTYNKIGELTSDLSEDISEIEWRHGDHKMKRITRGTSTTSQIEFVYNPFGLRVAKIEKTNRAGVLLPTEEQKVTYYSYDANGQVMGVYNSEYFTIEGKTELAEQYMYGASRLGVLRRNKILYESGEVTDDTQDGLEENIIGLKGYECVNHLGNVLSVVSDRKTITISGGIPKYEAVILSATDYYPFGMVMPGRSNGLGDYRFGYNGMEMDNEVSGNGNSYTTEFRQYDPRLMRWKSLDPLMRRFPHLSPYAAFDNNPIYFIDPYGLSSVNGGKDGGGRRSKYDSGTTSAGEFCSTCPKLPSENKLKYYKFDTDKGQWHGVNTWRLDSDEKFRKLYNEIGKHAQNVSNQLEKKYDLDRSRLKDDVTWDQNDNSFDYGYYLNLYYETSKGNRVKIRILLYQYNKYGKMLDTEGTDGNPKYQPTLDKVTPADIEEYCISNCYADALGLIGYVETTGDFLQILSDEYQASDKGQVGDIAFSYEHQHAMLVIGEKDGKFIYRSLWNGWGAVEEGTFDELYEKQFSTLNPAIKESDFKCLRKK